jgi:hypothetical protein
VRGRGEEASFLNCSEVSLYCPSGKVSMKVKISEIKK